MLLRFIVVFSCILSFVSFDIHAHKVKVVTEIMPPYQLNNAHGELDGYSTAVIKALFDITEDQYKIEVMPWARAYSTAINRKNCLIFSIARTDFRENKFAWVGSLLDEELFFWSLEGHVKQDITSVEQLKGMRIGAARDSNVHQYLSNNNFTNIVPIVSEAQSMQMLYSGRVDLVVGSELTFYHRTSQLDLKLGDMKKLIRIPELSKKLFIAFNKNTDSSLVTHYQKAFDQLIETGQLKEIQSRWGLTNNNTDLPEY